MEICTVNIFIVTKAMSWIIKYNNISWQLNHSSKDLNKMFILSRRIVYVIVLFRLLTLIYIFLNIFLLSQTCICQDGALNTDKCNICPEGELLNLMCILITDTFH